MLPSQLSKLMLLFTTMGLFLFGACSNNVVENSAVTTTGNEPVTSEMVAAVDGALVPIRDFKGVPTALWFWSPN